MGDEAITIIKTLIHLSAIRDGQLVIWPACDMLVDVLRVLALNNPDGFTDTLIKLTCRGWEYTGVIESPLKHGKDQPFHLLLTV